MRALESEVVDAVWAAVEALLPSHADTHPLGCHNPRIPDRVCFVGIVTRLVTGCSWVTAERLLGGRVSDTTLRARRDEWIEAGVFDALGTEAIAAYDRIVGLDLTDVAIDGSQHKAPCGGEGTGRNPTDRGKRGWKWSLMCDRAGIPVGWAADGANRHDTILFEPTLDDVARRGLLGGRRDPPPRPRLRQRHSAAPVHTARHRRRPLRPPATPRHRHSTDADPPRAAVEDRTHQLVAIELRPTPPQHRPDHRPPTRPTRPRHRPAHLRQTHRLAQPLEPHLTHLPAHALRRERRFPAARPLAGAEPAGQSG